MKAAEVQPKQRSATEAQAGQTEEQLHVAPRDVEVAVHFSADGVYTTAQPGEILWAVSFMPHRWRLHSMCKAQLWCHGS